MLRVGQLCKSYGEQVVFDDVSFLMTPGERLGLVGRNGHGKTTLFRLLLGEEQPDSGTIESPRDYRMGHLSQHLHFTEPTILDEVQTVLGDRVAEEGWRAEAALMGLGFTREDLARPAGEFSGGFQIRVNLARVLVDEPNLLLLDEPTNHLDIVSVRWLTRFLSNWPNELIIISHDRRFMDAVSTHSMVIHRQGLRRMEGGVGKLVGQIRTEEDVYERTRTNEERKRKREERFIERFRSKSSKASLVQSRIKALDKRGRMDELKSEDVLNFRFPAAPFHADTMMRVEGLAFGYPGGPTLFEDLDLEIMKGDRIGVIGPNGRGKSTLLNVLAGELKPRKGKIKNNPNTSLAFFGQTNIDRLVSGHTVEQEIQTAGPSMSRGEVLGMCGLLMFRGDQAAKPVDVLSGGERSRVLLGRLMASPSNLLLLDEPTNHLDIESIEALLDAVDAFPGAVVIVTHSEMILERMAKRLVIFDGGEVTRFESGYRDFLDRIGWADEATGTAKGDKRKRAGAAGAKAPSRPRGPRRPAKELRRLRAEIVTARGKITGPLRKRIDKSERAIERLEGEIAGHDAEMVEAAAAGRTEDLTRIATATKRKRDEVERLFGELERLTEELDRARADFDARLGKLA